MRYPSTMQLADVRFGYTPGQPVIDGVSGGLAAGRVTALIGPNAAGKTTLLRLMLGQLRPWSGRVELAGRDVACMAPAERARHVAYVPQRASVSFAFTVSQIVAMGRFALPPDDHAVDRALERCDLMSIADRVFAELSGGQQQRVLLARAMAQCAAARVLLADEPVSNMDLRHAHRAMNLLRRMAAEGLTVLAVLHDLTLASAYADDVWLMNAGRLLHAGSRQEVLQPAMLESIYGVRLHALTMPGGEDRPLILAQPMSGSDTMPAA